LLNRLTDKTQQQSCAQRSNRNCNGSLHYNHTFFFFLFLSLKSHPWPTKGREDASDQPFGYQKYFFKHYKDNIHKIMILTQDCKVRFMESKALEETFEILLL